jgi:ATP-dependent DNA helicase RecG
LIHREFANAFPAKLIIEKDRVLAENWNRPHDGGVIDPAKFFQEIGRVDELGSGVRNTFKYCGTYTPGTKPEFIEEDVFRTIIPLKAEESKEAVSASYWDEVRRKVRGKFGENRRAGLWKPVHICF